jgi:(2Fe-2S) ferredoxin
VLQAVSAVVGSSEDVAVLPCKCLGKCKQGPVVRVKQDGVVQCSVYTHLEPQQIPAILDTHFAQPVPQQQSGSVGAECCTDCHTGSTVQQPTSILAASLAASADLN